MYEEPRHICSVCLPGYPADSPVTPWRDDEGRWVYDRCPWPDLAEAKAAYLAFKDWRRTLHPVNTGRAEWLPDPFLEAMHVIEAAVEEQEQRARDAAAAKARG